MRAVFGVPEGGRPKTQNVSVVAIKFQSDKTTDIYFKDHFRMYDKEEIYLKSRFEVNGTGDSCVRCHKSGVLPIFPKPGSLSPLDQPKVDFVNSRLRVYGPPRFGGYFDQDAQGPGLAPVSAEARAARTESFLDECTQGIPFVDALKSKEKIKNSMSCSMCHNSRGLGSLDYPLNTKLIDSYVLGGLMPPGNSLNESERKGLLQCVKSEYLGLDKTKPALLLNWLFGH